MKSSNFSIVKNNREIIIIYDLGPWDQYPTVTNDAENVVAKLYKQGQLPGRKILLYYDSDGNLDQLKHDGKGNFLGFAQGRGEGIIMNKSTHTPEPWIMEKWENFTIFGGDEDNTEISEVYSINAEANARRICAAVNACEGISTEALDEISVTNLVKACNALLAIETDYKSCSYCNTKSSHTPFCPVGLAAEAVSPINKERK